MKENTEIGYDMFTPPKLSNHALIQSFTICSLALEEILTKILKSLPPDSQILLQYSGLLIKNTTQKLVDVTMLQSEIIPCESQSESQQKIERQNEIEKPFQQSSSKQKDCSSQNQNHQNSIQIKNSQKSACRSFKITRSFKLKEDEEIHLKKDGIKLVKKNQLKFLIQHRASNSHSSLHLATNKILPSEKTLTKKSIYEKDPHLILKEIITEEISNHFNQNPSYSTKKTLHLLTNKSTKSFSNLPGIQKGNLQKTNQNKERISASINPSQLINLKDYYRGKEDKVPNSIKKTSDSIIKNCDQNKNSLLSFLETFQQTAVAEASCWLNEKQNQKPDQADVMINKLRERKQKFYRTGQMNGDSYLNTKRQKTMMSNQNQKGSQNNQVGAMVAFDYSGQILPTFKYDTIKMQSHYQDMEFQIAQDDESFLKKKERKGHMFRGAINLKLVDPQKFIPHPHYKYEPLVQKPGMSMKENTAYSLKKGVEFKPKQQTPNPNGQNNVSEPEQTLQKINKDAFQFLYNDQLEANKVKYQDFIRFKRQVDSSTTLHKNISSRNKLHEQIEELILSKKSIASKCLKRKQFNQEDVNNKVYRSENRKALEMLITSVQLTCHDLDSASKQISDARNNDDSTNGVLKKLSLHSHAKQLQHNGQLVKKKVRIA